MFSLAIMTYVLLVGEHPFLTDSKLDTCKQKEADWSFLEQKAGVSPELKHFLILIGHQHKYSRLAASSALLHPFIVRRPLDESESDFLQQYYRAAAGRREASKVMLRQSLKLLL